MICHEYEGIDFEREPLACLLQRIKKLFVVHLFPKNAISLIASCGNMIDGACVLYAKWAGHFLHVTRTNGFVKCQALTPDVKTPDVIWAAGRQALTPDVTTKIGQRLSSFVVRQAHDELRMTPPSP